MGNLVGELFGAPSKSTSGQQSTSQSGYGALPGFAQNAFQQGVTGVQNLANSGDANLFATAPMTDAQNQAASLSGQGFTQLNGQNVNDLTQQYMNPYTNDVVNTTNQQILKANAGLLNQIGGDANQAGAFGGTRLGAAQANQNNNTLNTLAATDAGLNAGGYNTAQTNAMSSINSNNSALQNQIANLFNIGSAQQTTNTSQNQAPLTALQSLIAAAQGLPATSNSQSTGSTKSVGQTQGILNSTFFNPNPAALAGA